MVQKPLESLITVMMGNGYFLSIIKNQGQELQIINQRMEMFSDSSFLYMVMEQM